jgi:hypothetical protein
LFVFVLCLVYPMLPVSLDCLFLIAPCFVCLRPVSCVPNVASFSGLSILDLKIKDSTFYSLIWKNIGFWDVI